MAWSELTVRAAIQNGIPGNPVIFPVEGYAFSGKMNNVPHTLGGFFDCQIIYTANNYASLLTDPIDQVIFTPNDVYDGVTTWKLVKAANSYDAYINFCDAGGNVVYSAGVGYAPSYPQTYLSFLGYDTLNHDPIYGPLEPIHLIWTATQGDPNWPISCTWVSPYQMEAAIEGEWGQYPTYVNNLGRGSLIVAMDYIDKLFNGDYDKNNGQVAPEGGAGGGGGTFNRPNESVGIPSLPGLSVCDTGMISVYNVSTAQLQSLGNYLWDPSFFAAISKMFASPIENIITLQSVPVNASLLRGVASNIIIGNVDTQISAISRLTTTYYEVNCGTINVKECYKTFADYAPYVSIDLFLPYCGIVRINPDDVMNGYINVVYHVDVFSGSCVAFVNCNTGGTWHVLSQHSGNVCSQYPISGQNFASVYIGAINSIGMSAMGNPVGAFSSAVNMKPDYSRSGGVTSVSGLMGIQKPYLIFSTPKYIIASNYRDIKGYTSNLTVRIGDQSGYLQATGDNSELSSIPCTEEERAYIRQMLADGIYV